MEKYPLKHERLKQLYLSGFNVSDFVCFPPGKLDPVKLKKFFDKYKNRGGISLRHFQQDESRYFKCPVKYEVTDWRTVIRFCQEHNQQFYSLCNQAITLKDSIFAGNIWIYNERDFTVEYFAGPGSPRDTENKQLMYFTRAIGQPLPEGTPEELVRLGSLFRNFIPDQRPIVIEFNIYPYPIGKRKQNSIIWEWRQGLMHETSELVEYFVQENEILRNQLRALERLIKDSLSQARPQIEKALCETGVPAILLT